MTASAYSKSAYLHANWQHTKLVMFKRAKGAFTLYCQLVPDDQPAGKGHPIWYGKPFCLKEPETWDTPVQIAVTTFITHKKVTYRGEIHVW